MYSEDEKGLAMKIGPKNTPQILRSSILMNPEIYQK